MTGTAARVATEGPVDDDRRWTPPPIDAGRAAGHLRLTLSAALARPPCVRWPDAGWIADKRSAQLEAATLCEHCPILSACRAYVDEHPEPAGVWAGMLPPDSKNGRRHHVHYLDHPPIPADLDPRQPVDTLPRQALVELLQALAGRGFSERVIARMTGLSANTVADHLTDDTPLPPDLDPGRPVHTLAPKERVTLAHALAQRGTPLRVLSRMLGVSRWTAAIYLETTPGEAPFWRRPAATEAAQPARALTAEESTTLAATIRASAAAAHLDDGALPELARLTLHAAASDAPAALGQPNVHSYLKHALGDTTPRHERRRPVALALLAAGLSVRAAGVLSGANYGTVGRWSREHTAHHDDNEETTL